MDHLLFYGGLLKIRFVDPCFVNSLTGDKAQIGLVVFDELEAHVPDEGVGMSLLDPSCTEHGQIVVVDQSIGDQDGVGDDDQVLKFVQVVAEGVDGG